MTRLEQANQKDESTKRNDLQIFRIHALLHVHGKGAEKEEHDVKH